MNQQRRVPGWLAGILGAGTLIFIWWLLSVTVYHPDPGSSYSPVPSPFDVFSQIYHDGFNAYWVFFKVTVTEAAWGFVYGNVLALLLASTVLLAPRIEPIVMQIGVVTYCLPIVAVGGICIVVLGGADQPGDPSQTAVFLAAFLVFFTTLVGALLGFKAADAASLDVVSVYGGNRLSQLRKVRLIAALPSILSALQVAVPTAFLGAVLGEYMGATERSVGITLIQLQGNLDSVRVWAVFILCAVVALLGYGALGLVARVLTPWVAGSDR